MDCKEAEILDKAVAIAKVAVKAGEQHERNFKRIWAALIISILVNILLAFGFIWYESQWEYESVTEETTVTQDAGEGTNIYQDFSSEG